MNAATFAWSAACIAACRLPLPVAPLAATGERAGIRASLSAVRAIPDLGRLVALAATLNMVVAPVPMMIAALAIDRLDAGPATFGVLEMLLSAGLLVGSIAAGVLARGRPALAVPRARGESRRGRGGAGFGCCGRAGGGRWRSRSPTPKPSPGSNDRCRQRCRVGFGVLGSMSEGLRPGRARARRTLLAIAGEVVPSRSVGAGIVLAIDRLHPPPRRDRGTGDPSVSGTPGGARNPRMRNAGTRVDGWHWGGRLVHLIPVVVNARCCDVVGWPGRGPGGPTRR
ncbi:MAG: hypothetical protein R2713_16060 [Ilumatobacteraceae bacterium]